MAMAPCRACGEEISTELVVCPKCRVPRPTQKLRDETQLTSPPVHAGSAFTQRRMLLAGLAVLVLLGVGFCARSWFGDRREVLQLSVYARYGNALVTVVNRDDFDWTDCTARINAGIPGGGWERQFGLISAGDSARAPARNFAKPDGERFAPGTHHVQTLSLQCSTPGGDGHWSAGFAP
jgi:hypothetical protein